MSYARTATLQFGSPVRDTLRMSGVDLTAVRPVILDLDPGEERSVDLSYTFTNSPGASHVIVATTAPGTIVRLADAFLPDNLQEGIRDRVVVPVATSDDDIHSKVYGSDPYWEPGHYVNHLSGSPSHGEIVAERTAMPAPYHFHQTDGLAMRPKTSTVGGSRLFYTWGAVDDGLETQTHKNLGSWTDGTSFGFWAYINPAQVSAAKLIFGCWPYPSAPYSWLGIAGSPLDASFFTAGIGRYAEFDYFARIGSYEPQWIEITKAELYDGASGAGTPEEFDWSRVTFVEHSLTWSGAAGDARFGALHQMGDRSHTVNNFACFPWKPFNASSAYLHVIAPSGAAAQVVIAASLKD